MDLSTVRAQDMAIELIKRSKAGLAGGLDASYVALSVLDSLRTAGLPDIAEYVEDAETFVEHIVDILADELARHDSDSPLVAIRRVSEWAGLSVNPAGAPQHGNA